MSYTNPPEHPDNQQHEPERKEEQATTRADLPLSERPQDHTYMIIRAIESLATMINGQVMLMAGAIDAQSRAFNELREGLKGGRQVNEGRFSVLMSRIDVLEDTLRGKMELNQREVMTRLGVVENAAAQAVCRAWDRRPLNTGGGGGAPAEPDYHDKAPGI